MADPAQNLAPPPGAPPPAAPPAAPVLLTNEDGEVYRFGPDKASAALATGQWRPLSTGEAVAHRVGKEERAKGLVGSLEAAGSSAVNQLLLGVPGAVSEHTDTPEQAAERAAREDYHKTARLLGGAVGVGGSLLAGGELFKGAELAGEAVSRLISPAEAAGKAALTTKMAATAANYATQGALLASPQAIVHAAFGDPKQAAETLLWGVGAGAALGAGAELFSSGARATAEGLGKLAGSGKISDALADYARESTPTAFGAQRRQINRLSEDRLGSVVDFAHDTGLIQPGMDKQGLADAVKAAHSKYSGEIGDTIKGLDGALQKGKAETLEAALKPGQLGQEIRSAFETPEMKMPMNADQARALEMVAASADALPTKVINGKEVVAFDDAQKFITNLREKFVKPIGRAQNEGAIGASLGGLDVVSPLDRAKASAYSVVKKLVHDAGDAVAVASEQPALVGQLVKSKAALSKVAELEKWTANNAAREAGNRQVGLTDFLHMGEGGFAGKTTQGIGAAIGAAVGGPAGAIVGMKLGAVPGMALDYVTKHWMEDKGLVLLSSLARKAAKEGPEVFSAVMASEGSKRLAATMTGVSDTVRRMAIEGISDTKARTQEHMAALLGSTTGLTPDQSYQKLGTRLTQLAANPAAMANVTAALSAPYATVAPDVAAAYQDKLTQSLQYLYASLPKPVAPPAPFAPQTWSPSAADKLAFHDKAQIVANPMAAMDHVRQGTLSDAHLDALQTVFPMVYGKMKDEILKFSADHPDVKLPLAERQSVGRFLGAPLGTLDTPEQMRALQASFASGSPSSPPGQGGAEPGAKNPKAKLKDRPTSNTMFATTQGALPTT